MITAVTFRAYDRELNEIFFDKTDAEIEEYLLKKCNTAVFVRFDYYELTESKTNFSTAASDRGAELKANIGNKVKQIIDDYSHHS